MTSSPSTVRTEVTRSVTSSTVPWAGSVLFGTVRRMRAPNPSATAATAAGATRLVIGMPMRVATATTVAQYMITRNAHVTTCARACLCFDASERTRDSDSCALASIRWVIFPRSQVARRVSSIAPVTNSTISRPLLRAQREISVRVFRLSMGVPLSRGGAQPAPRSAAGEVGVTRVPLQNTQARSLVSTVPPALAPDTRLDQDSLSRGVLHPGVDLVGHGVGELQVGDLAELGAVGPVEELGVDVVDQPRAWPLILEIIEFLQVLDRADGQELDLHRVLGQLDDEVGRFLPVARRAVRDDDREDRLGGCPGLVEQVAQYRREFGAAHLVRMPDIRRDDALVVGLVHDHGRPQPVVERDDGDHAVGIELEGVSECALDQALHVAVGVVTRVGELHRARVIDVEPDCATQAGQVALGQADPGFLSPLDQVDVTGLTDLGEVDRRSAGGVFDEADRAGGCGRIA